MSDVATISILLDIKARLEELTRAQGEFRKTTEAASTLGQIFRQGLGIGTGIQLATQAVALFKATVVQAVRGAFQLADEITQGADDLQMSIESYQVFRNLIIKANGDVGLFTIAMAINNRSLVDARTGAGAAAAAYRDLGLNAGELENMAPERRIETIAKAIFSAADQQKAFSDAGAILGTRRLPILLAALRSLAKDGYDNLTEAQKKAGQIMDTDTAKRLKAAERAIAEAKQAVTIQIGETISGASIMGQMFKNAPALTGWNLLKTFLAPKAGLPSLMQQVIPFIPPGEQPNPNAQTAAQALAQKQEQLRNAERDLADVQLRQQTIEADANRTEADKRTDSIANLRQEIDLRSRIIDLIGQMPDENKDKTPQQQATELEKLRQQNLQASSQITALGGGAARDLIASFENDLTRVQQAEQALAQDPRYSELQKRSDTLKLLGHVFKLLEPAISGRVRR